MKKPTAPANLSAEQFIRRMKAHRAPSEVNKIQPAFETGKNDLHLGVRHGQIVALAKEFIDMPIDEIDGLLDSPVYDVRAGALSIMGKQAARKNTPAHIKKELYDLYLRRTDRMDSWQLVDISCHWVVGGYLLDKPRKDLYKLARSPHWWERRIAVYSTLLFIRKGDLDDAFKIAEMLIDDDEHFINTAAGGVMREAGKQDIPRLLSILDRYASTMPRICLRFAIEHLDKVQRDRYLGMKKVK